MQQYVDPTSAQHSWRVILDPLELAHSVVGVIEEKSGQDILLLDLRGISIITDFFVLGSGINHRHLKAVARTVMDAADVKRRAGARDLESQADSGWVLLDLGDVIVHLFTPEQRDYYDLESLWQDGQVLLKVQ